MEKIQSKLLALALAMFLVLANFAPLESSLAGESSQEALPDFVYKDGNGIPKMVMKVFKDEKAYKSLRSGRYDDKWYPGSPLPNWPVGQGGSDSPPPVA